jgi:hypothetical protein
VFGWTPSTVRSRHAETARDRDVRRDGVRQEFVVRERAVRLRPVERHRPRLVEAEQRHRPDERMAVDRRRRGQRPVQAAGGPAERRLLYSECVVAQLGVVVARVDEDGQPVGGRSARDGVREGVVEVRERDPGSGVN